MLIIHQIKFMMVFDKNVINIPITQGKIPLYMLGRAIWDKFSKIKRMLYPKNRPNQTCGYWLIIPNQQTLSIETNIF